MKDTQPDARPESQPTDTPVRGSTSKSSFNDAEYERWSKKLQSIACSKGK
jgi:hypothetical protein